MNRARTTTTGTCTYANGDAVIDSLNFDVDRLWPYFGVRTQLSLWALAVLVCVAQMACFSFVQAIWALTIIYRFVAFMTLKLKPVKPNLS
jgi:carbon starvation protein CstA